MVLLQLTASRDPVIARLSFLTVYLLSFSPRWQRCLPAPSQSVEGACPRRLLPTAPLRAPARHALSLPV